MTWGNSQRGGSSIRTRHCSWRRFGERFYLGELGCLVDRFFFGGLVRRAWWDEGPQHQTRTRSRKGIYPRQRVSADGYSRAQVRWTLLVTRSLRHRYMRERIWAKKRLIYVHICGVIVLITADDFSARNPTCRYLINMLRCEQHNVNPDHGALGPPRKVRRKIPYVPANGTGWECCVWHDASNACFYVAFVCTT